MQHGSPPQIVWLTCGNTSNAYLRSILVNAWPWVTAMLAAGDGAIAFMVCVAVFSAYLPARRATASDPKSA